MVKSRTITMSVNRKTGDVFDAILSSPPKIMPDATQNEDGSWSFSTPRGNATLKFTQNRTLGILDQQYTDNQATWNAPMKVVQSGDESEVVVTVKKPDILSNEEFDERMKELGAIFAELKTIIESN